MSPDHLSVAHHTNPRIFSFPHYFSILPSFLPSFYLSIPLRPRALQGDQEEQGASRDKKRREKASFAAHRAGGSPPVQNDQWPRLGRGIRIRRCWDRLFVGAEFNARLKRAHRPIRSGSAPSSQLPCGAAKSSVRNWTSCDLGVRRNAAETRIFRAVWPHREDSNTQDAQRLGRRLNAHH
jgi:hypothetical protein